MSFEQEDEAMLRDIKHVAHRSGGREAAYVVGIICILSIIGFSQVNISWLPVEVIIFFTLIVALLAGWGVLRLFAKMHGPKKNVRNSDSENRDKETDRQSHKVKSPDAFERRGQK